jgi:DNA modification methylase
VSTSYEEFLAGKRIAAQPVGFEPGVLHPSMRPDQRDITRWCIRRGRAAGFTDCGTGKTFIEQEFAVEVAKNAGTVLILSPLAVAEQTVAEGKRWGREIHLCESQADVVAGGINITNYQKLHKFTPNFAGIILDESSILKALDGSTRQAITEFAKGIPYRFAGTATPSPNDYTELGNHAEFLGIMTMAEMLATFFVHDGGETSKWRLKGHAEKEFFRWLASWAVVMRKPSDLGYSDEGFELPNLNIQEHVLDAGPAEGMLFAREARSLQERRGARRSSLESRVRECAERVNGSSGQWLVWCDLNDESDLLRRLIPGAIEVKGSDEDDHRRDAMMGFADGKYRVLVTKPRIAGWGMNWQQSHNMAFVGLSDSYEAFYQAIRRQWRYGQKNDVDVHLYLASTETAVLANLKRKQAAADKMAESMVEHMKEFNQREIAGASVRESDAYTTNVASGKLWRAYLGDCVELIRGMPDDYFHYSIYSPPFGSLYTYSNSERDMGNSRDWTEFWSHYDFLAKELYRVLKPGRQLSFHCMTMPTSKQNHGYIGAHDFRGDLIRAHEKHGFIFHSEVTIRKNPVTAMQRTKALGLLHKTIRTNRVMARQGFADYLVTMRKPGESEDKITGLLDCYAGEQLDEDFNRWCRAQYEEQKQKYVGSEMTYEEFRSIQIWQRYADPVWDDINPSDTLQRESAREDKDERHIAPLQLQVIERGLQLWTQKGERVLSPFGGIGSEGYVAVKMEREAVICELKRSYFQQACLNLKRAESEETQPGLDFGMCLGAQDEIKEECAGAAGDGA